MYFYSRNNFINDLFSIGYCYIVYFLLVLALKTLPKICIPFHSACNNNIIYLARNKAITHLFTFMPALELDTQNSEFMKMRLLLLVGVYVLLVIKKIKYI